MAGYQKKIAYLDYLENGMKIRNAGFLRIEELNGQTRLEMRIKNIPEQFAGEYEVNADVGGVVGHISLSHGSGSCCVVWKNTGDRADGKKRVQAYGIYIRLPGRHLLQVQWEEPVELLVEKDEEPAELLAEKDEEPAELLAVKDEESVELPEKKDEETVRSGPEVSASELENPVAEERIMPGEPEAAEQAAAEMEPAEEAVCYGEKWEQLSHMYPIIRPFGDEREYLSIAPKDFVVLRREYQKMVHNSFLLHGYYNYRHLILGKIMENEEWHYYLGVPGNFYAREKMVAEMFGFEAFEGEKEPAEAGEFGYFMKRVEI